MYPTFWKHQESCLSQEFLGKLSKREEQQEHHRGKIEESFSEDHACVEYADRIVVHEEMKVKWRHASIRRS